MPLQEQPFQVLAVLLRHRGEIVAREELQRALWPADTFVEFDHGVNTAINKLRQALGDSADNPRFIETLTRKGYRFIAPVESLAHPASIPPPAPIPVPEVRKRGWWYAIAGLVVVAAGCAAWLWNKPARSTMALPVPVPFTTYPGLEASPSFSPEGDRVAFSWDGPKRENFDIYVNQIGADVPVRLTMDPDPDVFPAWSPDGRWIAFQRKLSDEKFGVFLIPAVGGAERKLTEVLCGGKELQWWGQGKMSWLPSSRRLVVPDRNSVQEPLALFLVSVETGEKRKLTSPPQGLFGDVYPSVSPDGRALVFTRAINGLGGSDLFLLELPEGSSATEEPKRITFWQRNTDEAAWWPDGNSILFASGTSSSNKRLWQMAIRGSPRQLGDPEPLPFGGATNYLMPTISRQGRVVYMQFVNRAHIWRLELGGGHRAEKLPMNSSRLDFVPQYSPDGKRIAFTSDRSGSHEIWVCDADGLNAVKLTSFGGPYVAGPAWSPDGRRIAFTARPGGIGEIDIVSVDGGKPERLRGAHVGAGLSGWSRDGKWIYFVSKRNGNKQVWKIPVNGGEAVQITKQGGAQGVESPDRKFFYYLFDRVDGENTELRRVPVEGGEEVRIVPSVCSNAFAVIDRGIYFLSDWENPSVQRFDFASRMVETVAKLKGRVGWGFSVSPDGRWLLYTTHEGELGQTDLMMVEKFR